MYLHEDKTKWWVYLEMYVSIIVTVPQALLVICNITFVLSGSTSSQQVILCLVCTCAKYCVMRDNCINGVFIAYVIK